jgi:hypothetical protein
MKNRFLTLITLVVSVGAASLSSAQGVSVDHYRTKGYTHGASLSYGGLGVQMRITEVNAMGLSFQPNPVVFAAGMGFEPGGLAVYTPDPYATPIITVNPAGPSLNGQSYASITVPARKVVYAIGTFNQTVTLGTLTIESTLTGTGSAYVSNQLYHNDLVLPGLGMVFEYTQMLTGRIAEQGLGYGGATFTPTGGTPVVLIPAGTPTTILSFGYVQEGSIVISR